MTENHHTEQMLTRGAYSDTALFHYLYQNISHLICFQQHSSILHPKIPPQILNMHLSNNNQRSSEMSHCAFVQCFHCIHCKFGLRVQSHTYKVTFLQINPVQRQSRVDQINSSKQSVYTLTF